MGTVHISQEWSLSQGYCDAVTACNPGLTRAGQAPVLCSPWISMIGHLHKESPLTDPTPHQQHYYLAGWSPFSCCFTSACLLEAGPESVPRSDLNAWTQHLFGRTCKSQSLVQEKDRRSHPIQGLKENLQSWKVTSSSIKLLLWYVFG